MRNNFYFEFQAEVQAKALLRPVDVLLVGATGSGKSSTLNSIFGTAVAKVGQGVEPETQVISEYGLHDYLRLHDSAGLGDGKGADLRHAKNITDQLIRTCRVNGEDYGFIDMVLVILDGSSRDLGTAFRLLESVILKCIDSDRVVVAINQADMAMKGRGWNYQTNKPEADLSVFLREQAMSAQKRIRDSTGCTIRLPVNYSAAHEYNIDGLMRGILAGLPKSRRGVGLSIQHR